jgi:hypothetical protein
VRRQSLDVAALLGAAAGRSRYFLFYEDDFHFCRDALVALQYMVGKAHRAEGRDAWSAIRCSFGLAGIVMQNGGAAAGGAAPTHADVAAFRRYLLLHFGRRPPDHLAVEFYARESRGSRAWFGARRVMAFRYNVLRHDGATSTLRESGGWSMPGCFTPLVAPQLFEVEAWSERDCPHDDLWPCDSKARQPGSIDWGERKE